MAAEQLTYPDRFADLVFGHSILHHTDLALTRQEVDRILKRGGRAVFLESLGHNLIINVLRKLAPVRRTLTEKPLTMDEIMAFARPFSEFEHREFYLLACTASALLPLRSKRLFFLAIKKFERLDEMMFSQSPNLGKYTWVIVFKVVK